MPRGSNVKKPYPPEFRREAVRLYRSSGHSLSQIARRLGMNRETVARMLASEEPPRYRRSSAGSQLDPFEPVLRRLLEEWPEIKAPRASEVLREHGYAGSVDLVRRRLRGLRPPAVRPAQRTGYRPGQVLQLDDAWRRSLQESQCPSRATGCANEAPASRPQLSLETGLCVCSRDDAAAVSSRCDTPVQREGTHGNRLTRTSPPST